MSGVPGDGCAPMLEPAPSFGRYFSPHVMEGRLHGGTSSVPGELVKVHVGLQRGKSLRGAFDQHSQVPVHCNLHLTRVDVIWVRAKGILKLLSN